jgi:hypothetical protein
VYHSFSLATNLKHACKNAYSSTRLWLSKGKISLNKSALCNIGLLLLETLLAPEEDPIWTRLIAILVRHVATHWLRFDASYAGIGSWTLDFGTCMWRVLTRKDLKLPLALI